MRSLWTTALLVGALVSGGCSSTDDPGPTPATASSTAASPEESATTSEAVASAGLDACDLLAPADYNRFISANLRGTTSESHTLDGELGTMNTCRVTSGPYTVFSFGYSTDSEAWSVIERRTRPTKIGKGGDRVLRKVAEMTAQKRQEVPNVAEEAYFSSGLAFTRLYALEEGISFRIAPNGLTATGDNSLADYMAVMIAMIAKATEGVDSDPVQLPPQCPAADSTEVAEVIGEVAQAYGSAYQGIAPSCHYLAADGRTLGAGSTFFGTEATFAREAQLPAEVEGMTVLDPPPGMSSGIRREGRGWLYHSALPARLETVGVSTGRPDWGPRPTTTVDRGAFLAFVDAYRALASEQLGAPY